MQASSAELVELLRDWLDGREPGKPVFNMARVLLFGGAGLGAGGGVFGLFGFLGLADHATAGQRSHGQVGLA